MADTFTTNLNLTKPEPGAAEDTWGISLNADLDALDAIFSSSGTQINLNPNQINFGDNKKAIFGAGSDLQIYHDGSNSYIRDIGTGNLNILADELKIMNAAGTENKAFFVSDGGAYLYHNNSAKLETTSTGIDVTGVITTDGLTTSADINFGDSDKAVFGTSNDLQIYHNGLASFITDVGTGDLFVRASNSLKLQSADGENYLVANANGAVTLYYNNSAKLATTSAGINVTGTVTSDGLSVASDTNVISTLGRAKIGAFVNDYAYFSHIDHATTSSYALNQNSAGATSINAASGSSIGLKINNSNALTVASNSNVGIGTTSPSSNLHIKTSVDNSLSQGLVIERSANTDKGYINYQGGAFQFRSTVGDPIAFGDTSNEYVRIANGNVGIGTTSPSEDFHISGDTSVALIEGTNTSTSGLVAGVKVKAQFYRRAGFSILDESDNEDFFIGRPYGAALPVLVINTDGSERMRIDSSGRVGIGRTPTSNLLEVADTIKLTNLTAGEGFIGYNTNGVKLGITATDSVGAGMKFEVGASERARIDSSGNLMVGKTTAGVSTTGVELRNYGQIIATRSGNYPLLLNRTSSDGDIIQLRKDGTTVGSIGALGGDLTIGTGDTGLRFNDGIDTIIPTDISTNAISNNVVILGHPDYRFKDLYLGGSANVNKVSVDGSGANGINLEADSSATTNSNRLFFSTSAGSNSIMGVSGALTFRTGATAGSASGTERMRLDSSGNFLVGKTSTSVSTDGVEARANGLFAASRNGNTVGIFNRNTSDGDIVDFRKDGSVVGVIGTETWGIGTSSPDSNVKLDLNSGTNNVALGIQSTDSGAYVAFKDSGTTGTYGAAAVAVGAISNNLLFRAGSAEVGRFTSSGRLGIGTTSPSFPLEIKCDSNHRAISFIETGGGTETWQIGVDGDGDLGFFDSTSTTQSITFQDGTGNIGIGTDSPSRPLHIAKSSGTTILVLQRTNINTTGTTGAIQFNASDDHAVAAIAVVGDGDNEGGEITFRTTSAASENNYFNSTTERMRIDSSGHILFGTTSAGTTHAYFDPSSNSRMVLSLGSSTTTTSVIAAYKNPNGTVGTVSTNGSATSYNTSSDARLKDVTGKARGLDVINALNPVSYNWKADGKADEGLIAQEVQEIVPNAVSQNEEEYYQMDYSKLVVHLVKGMKEQQEQIESLKSEINLLKGE
jgi:hypothetical protein